MFACDIPAADRAINPIARLIPQKPNLSLLSHGGLTAPA